MKYIVTVYCGKRGPVRDVKVQTGHPADAIREALFLLSLGEKRHLTEVHVDEITEA